VDGFVHDTPEAVARDEARTRWLQARGYDVVRVRNTAVREDINFVLEAILAAAAARPPSPSLPLEGGGGEERGR
jgi:very-short-patch-repair endonuclease